MRRWIASESLIIHWSCLLIGLIACSNTPAHAESPASFDSSASDPVDGIPWPRFHGAMGYGNAGGGRLPTTWTEDDYVWSLNLGGTDVGSLVATENTVFLLDAKVERSRSNGSTSAGTIDFVAVDVATGQVKWRHSHPFVDRKRHSRNSPASTTPAIAGDRVFFAYGDAQGAYLYAYTLAGVPLWNRQLGPWTGVHGFGTSPMVSGSQVILFNSQQVDELERGQIAGQSHMMSFDIATGKDLWSTPLTATRPCYGVPSVFRPAAGPGPAGPPQLIAANKGNGMFGLDLTTGAMLWSLPVFNKRCCSSPLIVGDLAIASCGSGGGGNYMSAVRIPQHVGDSPEEVFRISRGAGYVPTPAVKNSLIFTVSDNGIASCFDTADDGRLLWSQRIGGNFGASPIIVGEQLLLVSLEGKAHVTTASDRKSDLSEVNLSGRVGATPAFAAGRLLLRVGSQLHCLDCTDQQ